MWSDPAFWVGAAFVAFVLLVAKPVGQKISAALDGRAAQIRAQLEEAVRLREEAQALLARYQRQQNEAVKETAEILAFAREEAERQAKRAEAELEARIKHREEQAMGRLAHAEKEALAEVRGAAVDLGVRAAQHLLSRHVDRKTQSALVDEAITTLESRLV